MILIRIVIAVFAVLAIYMAGVVLLNNIRADDKKHDLFEMKIESVRKCVIKPFGFVPGDPHARVIILMCEKSGQPQSVPKEESEPENRESA